jgi:lipoprotein-anchoring transpeptidase ErfK/SrfK
MLSRHLMRIVRLFLLASALIITAACGTSNGAVRPTASATTATATPSCSPTPVAPTPTQVPSPTATPKPTPKPTPTQPPKPAGVPPAPVAQGKVVLVNLTRQWLYAYQDGRYVFDNAVETGMPELPTPTGHFSVLSKQRDLTFISPWPEGSPYWYAPTHVSYAMLFRQGGYYLHDAWWHVLFGPGANVPHQLPDGRWETGSHGCVGMPVSAAQRLYGWVAIGTPVIIVK